MATGAAHGGTRSEAVRANEGLSYRQAIDRQLNRTRRQVKLVELGAGSVLLLAGVLGYLLLASLVDHWVISLGHVGRTVLLGVLLVGVVCFAWRRLLPLLVRSINPEYAAHAIEESTPSLKNSLLNFLLLRRSPAGVKEVVMEALEKRAASDIAAVPVDAAVDRSKVIRMGYLLVGVMAILGLYKILSPKDPFQTAARVFAPWADIARPSRVQISDVQPGSAEVYIGETVKVSAAVAGASDDDPVSVVYSTADGTVIDQRVPMTAAGGGRFEATLPAGGAAGTVSSTGGLQQNTIYRLEAGDAVTSEYRLNVIASPRIVVEKVDYAFPAYARKAPQSTERGDLKGLEGTRVTITARANQPIKTAWIEFDPDPNSGPAETMKLDVSGDQATGVLVLQLRPDRRTAWRTAYQLRFINERQQQSQQPVLHGIEVLRDLPPEVEIIAPQSREIEVPENGVQAIEVRAVDPDFGLTKVDLMGRARNKEVVMRSLLEPADGELPQVSRKFTFRPSEWMLKAGEELSYWAVAEDNRTAVPSVASVRGAAMPTADPQPNVAKTESYTIRIVPARTADQRGGAANDPNAAGNEEQPGEANDGAGQNDSPMNGGQQSKSNSGDNQSAKENGDSQQGENSEQGNKGDSSSQKSNQSGQNSQQSSGSDSGEGDSQSQQGGGSSSSGEMGESGSQNGGDASAGGESGGSGKADGKTGNQSGAQSGNPSGSQESGEPTESGSQGGGSKGGSQQGSRSDGNEPQQTDQSGDAASQQGSRGGSGGTGSKKPEHDGDVFDKLLDEMQQEEGSGSGQPQSGEGGQGAQQPGENNATSNDAGSNQASQGKAGEENAGQNKAQGGNQRDPMTGNNSAGGNAGEAGSENPADQADREGNQKGQRGGEGNQTQDKSAQPGGGEAGSEKSQGGQEQPGKNGSQGGKAGKAGSNNRPQPDGNQGSPEAGGTEKSDGQQGTPQQPMGQDDGQGKGPNEQKAPGEGGRPQGAARTDEGDPKSDKQGTGGPKEAGAGQNGDSGAGKNSKDKTGSGQGQETNRDRQKEMSDSNATPENGETSAPSNSKRQSDSKGGSSGDRSGGGSKGAGQSGGQEGNDTAGSNSAADEGASAANETGMGETGSKGGQGEKSDGKTGSAGNEKGDGSSSRPGENGKEQGGTSPSQKGSGDRDQPMNQGEQGPQSGQGDAAAEQSQNNQSEGARGKKSGSGTGPVVGGGVDADRPPAGYTSTGEYTDADKANLDFAKKATDLVLSKLKEQEHDPDPELLDRMGMTREQMQEFIRRWDRLKSEAERDPNAARELDDALRSLGLKDPKQRKRSGGTASDDQRGLRDSGTRVPPPSRYRDQFDAFRKGAARAGNR